MPESEMNSTDSAKATGNMLGPCVIIDRILRRVGVFTIEYFYHKVAENVCFFCYPGAITGQGHRWGKRDHL